MNDDRTPVTVLTGFLGSGKTTLLRRLLSADGMDRTAVVINEFGEVGLDHLLVRSVTDNAVVLQNGCICCTIRSDIQTSFRELIDGRASGEVPPFDRIVVETTGLADPVPIVQTLVGDPMLRHQTRMANVVATIDAVLGLRQLGAHPESLRQAAIADCLVLTKADIAEPQAADLVAIQARLAQSDGANYSTSTANRFPSRTWSEKTPSILSRRAMKSGDGWPLCPSRRMGRTTTRAMTRSSGTITRSEALCCAPTARSTGRRSLSGFRLWSIAMAEGCCASKVF